jgi:hypothetical protein
MSVRQSWHCDIIYAIQAIAGLLSSRGRGDALDSEYRWEGIGLPILVTR